MYIVPRCPTHGDGYCGSAGWDEGREQQRISGCVSSVGPARCTQTHVAPPPHTETPKPRCYQASENPVGVVVSEDLGVACIVDNECDLMPAQAKKDCRCVVVPCASHARRQETNLQPTASTHCTRVSAFLPATGQLFRGAHPIITYTSALRGRRRRGTLQRAQSTAEPRSCSLRAVLPRSTPHPRASYAELPTLWIS